MNKRLRAAQSGVSTYAARWRLVRLAKDRSNALVRSTVDEAEGLRPEYHPHSALPSSTHLLRMRRF